MEKYVELQDAYMSVREALKHAALANDVEVEIGWVHSADLEKDKGWDVIQNSDAILVPGGFGSRGIEQEKCWRHVMHVNTKCRTWVYVWVCKPCALTSRAVY